MRRILILATLLIAANSFATNELSHPQTLPQHLSNTSSPTNTKYTRRLITRDERVVVCNVTTLVFNAWYGNPTKVATQCGDLRSTVVLSNWTDVALEAK